MSRIATNEYIDTKRRLYATADRTKRTGILDEVCETTGYERKYANRLLTGSRKFRRRKGRGKTHGEDAAAVLKKVWLESGCPCLPYFKAESGRWVDEYSTQVAHIEPSIREKILAMGDRTMSRMLSGETRIKPGWAKGNRRSGLGGRNEVKNSTPCDSGESIRACNVPPGDVQVDTFALGGGDCSDSFFWILDASDRKTQWTVLGPTWNRGQYATLEALKHIEGRFPFEIVSLHSDNGGEILNHHVSAYLGGKAKQTFLWRSRPRHSNDNARVEEKNRSSGRQLFGEIRLDCPVLQDELTKLCDDWSDFRNFFRPCKMLAEKTRRDYGKGYKCRYDKPKTPYQRVLDDNVLTPEQKDSLKAYKARLSGMDLCRRVRKRLRKIRRIQNVYTMNKYAGKDLSPFAARPALALRATPSGTAGLHREGTHNSTANQRITITEKRRLSVQHLANQKTPGYLHSVFSI